MLYLWLSITTVTHHSAYPNKAAFTGGRLSKQPRKITGRPPLARFARLQNDQTTGRSIKIGMTLIILGQKLVVPGLGYEQRRSWIIVLCTPCFCLVSDAKKFLGGNPALLGESSRNFKDLSRL